MTQAKLRLMLDTQASKQRDRFEKQIAELQATAATKERQYTAARKAMLEEIVYLRDQAYSKKNVEAFKKEDIFRLEMFTVEQVVDPQSAKLMNDRLRCMQEFYVAR